MLQLSEKSFLKRFLSLVFGAMLFIALFNWIEDPYYFFHSPVVKGFNDQPVPAPTTRIIRPYDVTKSSYDALIMSSSRGNALKPHESWQGFNVFNMSINAGTIYEMYRYIQHAHAHYPLKRLIIGLDLMSFSAAWKFKGQFDEDRLLVTERLEGVEPLLRRQLFFRDISGMLGSNKATAWSFEKMITSFKNNHSHEKDHRDYHSVFVKVETGFMEKNGLWLNSPEDSFETFNPVSGYDTVETFEKLVQFCYVNDIDMKIYFSPIHARLLLGMFCVGLWDELKTLKTNVYRINQKLAEKHDSIPYDIWDFTTINSYSQEPIPPLGQEMQWYVEDSHFLPALADKLQTVITGVGEHKDIERDFGVLLSIMKEDQLGEYYSQQLERIRKYVADHPEDAVEIFAKAKELGTLDEEMISRSNISADFR
jgi:hypothetical protein